MTGVSGPSTGITGQTVLLNWTDTNSGTAPATGPWVDKVYTTTDAQGGNPTLVGSFTFEGTLAVGASLQRTQQIALPPASGTRWFSVVTNATQTVAEGANGIGDTTVAANSIAVAVTAARPGGNRHHPAAQRRLLRHLGPHLLRRRRTRGTGPTSAPVWHDWVILSQDPTLAPDLPGPAQRHRARRRPDR